MIYDDKDNSDDKNYAAAVNKDDDNDRDDNSDGNNSDGNADDNFWKSGSLESIGFRPFSL